MKTLAFVLAAPFCLTACVGTVVSAAGNVVEGAVNVTGDIAEGAVDVVTTSDEEQMKKDWEKSKENDR